MANGRVPGGSSGWLSAAAAAASGLWWREYRSLQDRRSLGEKIETFWHATCSKRLEGPVQRWKAACVLCKGDHLVKTKFHFSHWGLYFAAPYDLTILR